MFVIVVYDAGENRVQKFLKVCRKYLVHVQRSVFEGEVTEAQLRLLKNEIRKIMNPEEDSLVIYKFRTKKYYERETIGVERPSSENFFMT